MSQFRLLRPVVRCLILAGPALEQTDFFLSGTDGCHTYRIPAVLRTSAGTLLAFAEGRRLGGGDTSDIDLLVKRTRRCAVTGRGRLYRTLPGGG